MTAWARFCEPILILFANPCFTGFYLCEQKMTSVVKAMKQAQILDPRQIHQQSYPQAVTF